MKKNNFIENKLASKNSLQPFCLVVTKKKFNTQKGNHLINYFVYN